VIDLALGIGVNGVDPNAAAPAFKTLPVLKYAENSARLLASLFKAPAPRLLGAAATKGAVADALGALAAQSAGQTVLVTFSGHGLQLTDEPGIATGSVIDGWCLYDQPLRDDAILAALERFDPTCTVLLVSDCCYGGGIVDGALLQREGDRIRATVVSIAACGPHDPAFRAANEPVSALSAAIERELATPGNAPPPSYSDLEKRLQRDLWETMMRQVPTVNRFGKPGAVDEVVPFWKG
jgi:hypothetical protein